MRVIKITPILFLGLTFFLNACFGPEPQKPKPEEFLTLADLTGRVTLQEDSPDVRVLRVKKRPSSNVMTSVLPRQKPLKMQIFRLLT